MTKAQPRARNVQRGKSPARLFSGKEVSVMPHLAELAGLASIDYPALKKG